MGNCTVGELIAMCRQIMRPERLFYVYLRDIHGAITENMLLMDDDKLEQYFNYKIWFADFDEDDYCFKITVM